MSGALAHRLAGQASRPLAREVTALARQLGEEAGALAVLFYGSNLRTGALDGVLDFYVLLPGPQTDRIWPRVSYREVSPRPGLTLRAKIATMALRTFLAAAQGNTRDTTIWARFVQPAALGWHRDAAARAEVLAALAAAARTAARLAVALGPEEATEEEYWAGLFRATYSAEFRVEAPGRERSILEANPAHFAGLLPAALEAEGIACSVTENGTIRPVLSPERRQEILRWWRARRRLGKALNLLRLLKASTTFDGAARYAAWKIERHTGVPVTLTPWRERHPVLAAPGVLYDLWRKRRGR